MEVRVLKPEEHIFHSAISSQVFLDMRREDIRAKLENPAEHKREDDYLRIGCFNEKGKLQSAMTIVPFTMRMNGKEVKMGGVGAVVTLPEARGKGAIRKIFEKAFPMMIENGQVFSYLYPFSQPFYRLFGYEVCRQSQDVSIPINQFRGYPYPTKFEAYEPGDSTEPYAKIYEKFAQNQNLSIVRSEENWNEILKRDPYKNLEFTYLNYNKNDEPDAYILYGVSKDDGNNIGIKECAYTSPEGLHSIFGFLSKMGAEYNAVKWSLPSEINASSLFPDDYNVDKRLESGGMNRIVSVIPALETLKSPCNFSSGKVTIGVKDKFWETNTGVYSFEWDKGTVAAKLLDSKTITPDLETSIETLAQLVTGYITIQEAIYKPCTKVYNEYENLSILFPRRSIYLMEYF